MTYVDLGSIFDRQFLGTLAFCAVVVVCARLRPWRWLSSWVRRG